MKENNHLLVELNIKIYVGSTFVTWASLKLGEFSLYFAAKKSRRLVMLGYLLLIE